MQVEYKHFNSNRKFGIELEVEPTLSKLELSRLINFYENYLGLRNSVKVEDGLKGWAESINNDYWHVKYDSTCGPKGYKKDSGGWEIASYVGEGLPDIINIANLSEFLKDHKVEVNDNCGLHIHVDVSDHSMKDIGILLAHWIKIEKFILHSCPIHRKKNRYCKSLSPRFKQIQKNYNLFYKSKTNHLTPVGLWDCLRPINLGTHDNYDKKVTLNTVGVARHFTLGDSNRITVELRVPECILNKEHVSNWIKLIINFIDSCKNRDMPKDLNPSINIKDVLNILGLEDESKFLILDINLKETKVWFLQRLMEFSGLKNIEIQSMKKVAFLTRI